MSRRKLAIAVIVADVAETGIAGRSALRAYVETRMSRQTFDEACRIGQALFHQRVRRPAAGLSKETHQPTTERPVNVAIPSLTVER